MSTRPTSVPYRWATNLANRVAPTAAQKIAGWAGGQPVPSLKSNDLWGMLSDWVEYIATGAFPSTVRVMAQSFNFTGGNQWDTTVTPGIGTPGTLQGVVSFLAGASTQPIAMGSAGPVAAGGTPDDMIVRYLTTWSGADHDIDIRVDVLDRNAVVVQTYTGALPDTASAWDEFTLTPSITPQPDVEGPITLVARFRSDTAEAADYTFSLDWIELAFA